MLSSVQSQAVIDDCDILMKKHEVMEPTRGLPPIETLGIDCQGKGKTGKTTLAVGNPHCAVAKLNDGSPIVRRARATIFSDIHTLPDFEGWLDDMISLRRKHGKNSRWRMICIDPTFVLVDMLIRREVTKYNATKKGKADDGEGLITTETAIGLIDHVSEIPGAGPYYKVADALAGYLRRISSVGMGWMTCTHYDFKVTYANGVPAGQSWQPDIPPTSAKAISKISDVLMVTSKIGNQRFIEFQNDRIEELGGRVPLLGNVQVPDYNEDGGSAVAWDYVYQAYEVDAKKRWAVEARKFYKSLNETESEVTDG